MDRQSDGRLVNCSLCSDSGLQLDLTICDYIKHLRLFHAHQAHFKFTCGIDGCVRSYTNIGTFKNHVSAVHYSSPTSSSAEILANPTAADASYISSDIPGALELRNGTDSDFDDAFEDVGLQHNDELGSQDLSLKLPDQCMLQKSSALFLLGLKEKHKLTQVAVQEIVESVTSLTQQRLSVLKQQVDNTLLEAGIPEVDGLQKHFEDAENLFQGLETPYLQLQYCKKNLHLIEPVRVLLGERHVWKGSGTKRKCISKEDNVFYIPVLETLQGLLNNETVLSEIENGHKSCSGILNDYCDGGAFLLHPLYSIHKNALQIFFYFDELETCNPLGSKVKLHKLGAFYFTLGNLSPKYRSQLTSIYLVALVKSSFITIYGMDAILRPFVNDVKKLENGVEFLIHGNSKVIFGTVALVSADNLGSLSLGGFKESCSAYRMCRHCMCTKDEFGIQFLEKNFELRNKTNHKQHCELIESDPSGEASKEHGINRDSILNELKYFHVCDGSLLPDVMHDILEGSLQYEMKLMLQVMVNTGYFSLDDLNMRLENFELGYMESKNRPSLFSAKNFNSDGKSLKQNASQMNLLGHILPLLIGYFIPEDDEHWQLFLQLMDTVDLLLSPYTSDDHASYTSALISEHHQDFCRLYPDKSIIPKMHFMVHMPRLMNRYGPLVRHWTMRFEAKHSYFKSLAQSMGNFINLPYSLAMRHQQYLSYLNASKDLLCKDFEVGKGSVVPTTVIGELGESITSLFKTAWVKYNGLHFKQRAGIIIDVEDDLPVVGQIEEIYVADKTKIFFRITQYHTYYEPHYRAYTFRNDTVSCSKLLLSTELFLPVVIHIRRSQTLGNYVILPHALCTL